MHFGHHSAHHSHISATQHGHCPSIDDVVGPVACVVSGDMRVEHSSIVVLWRCQREPWGPGAERALTAENLQECRPEHTFDEFEPLTSDRDELLRLQSPVTFGVR